MEGQAGEAVEVSLRVVAESASAIAVDKPAGWLTIPGRRGDEDPRPVLVHAVGERTGGKVFIVHRLDREVSGVVLFAKTAEAHRTLSVLFESREVSKRYEAWTEGEPPAVGVAPQTWEGWLIRGKRRVHEAASEGKGKWSRTVATFLGTVVREGRILLRWQLRPETGRPHQLRVQAAARGFPIAGDALYGSNAPFRPDEIALRAVAIESKRFARESLGLPERIEVAGLDL